MLMNLQLGRDKTQTLAMLCSECICITLNNVCMSYLLSEIDCTFGGYIVSKQIDDGI